MIRKKIHLYLKVWIQQCIIMHYEFVLNVSTFNSFLAVNPPTQKGCVNLTTVSCPLRADRPDLHQQIKNCQLLPAAALQRIFTWYWTKKKTHTLWSHRGKRLQVVQFCDLWYFVCVFNDDFHKNPQNTAYSTVYKVLLRLGSKVVTAQLSLSLIKYWTRGIREKLRAERKKKANFGFNLMCVSPPVAPLREAFNQ